MSSATTEDSSAWLVDVRKQQRLPDAIIEAWSPIRLRREPCHPEPRQGSEAVRAPSGFTTLSMTCTRWSGRS